MPLVYAAGRGRPGAARARPWARRSAGRTSSTTSALKTPEQGLAHVDDRHPGRRRRGSAVARPPRSPARRRVPRRRVSARSPSRARATRTTTWPPGWTRWPSRRASPSPTSPARPRSEIGDRERRHVRQPGNHHRRGALEALHREGGQLTCQSPGSGRCSPASSSLAILAAGWFLLVVAQALRGGRPREQVGQPGGGERPARCRARDAQGAAGRSCPQQRAELADDAQADPGQPRAADPDPRPHRRPAARSA